RGDARPAWKVLRVLGNLLQLAGFDQESADQVRALALAGDVTARLSNAIDGELELPAIAGGPMLHRLADVPIYSVDPIVRRAVSLQLTRDAEAPAVRMNAATLASLGLVAGERVRVTQPLPFGGRGEAVLVAALDARVADGTVRLSAAHSSTATLGAMFGEIAVERA
ncbi:MAG: molybdopterin dinucleotide binding domain-containing protein, partial [Burkholderiaceae bacterium]